MQFFDRPGAGRSKINLRGSSSRPPTSEELLAKARQAREKRALLRQKHQVATLIQSLYRGRAAAHFLSQPRPAPQNFLPVEPALCQFVLLSGLVHIQPTSVSACISATRAAVSSRSFLAPLAQSLSHALQREKSVDHPSSATIPLPVVHAFAVKSTALLLAFASFSMQSLVSQTATLLGESGERGERGEPDASQIQSMEQVVLCSVHAARRILENLPNSTLLDVAKWGIVVHVIRLLRFSMTTPHRVPGIEQILTSLIACLFQRAESIVANDEPASRALQTQLAISLLSLDGIMQVDGVLNIPRLVSALISSVAQPFPNTTTLRRFMNKSRNPHDAPSSTEPTSQDEGIIDSDFTWDCVHDLEQQSDINLAVMLSNVLHLSGSIWFNNSPSVSIWPFIAAVSSLIHALPKEVLFLSDDPDDDYGMVVGAKFKQRLQDQRKNGDAFSYESGYVGAAGSHFPSDCRNGQVQNESSSQFAESKGPAISAMDVSALRSVMSRVSSSLSQMVSDSSAVNVFAYAIKEGQKTTVHLCNLFCFLARRQKRLTISLQNSLAFWRRPRTEGTPHVLSSLWRYCITTVHSREDERVTTTVLKPDCGPILSVFAGAYAYLLYIQDVDEMFDSSWPFSVEEVREMTVVLKQQLYGALYTRTTWLAGSERPNPTSSAGHADEETPSSSLAPSTMYNFLRSEDALLEGVTRLLSRLHAVDLQRKFTVGDFFWEVDHPSLNTSNFLQDAVRAGPEALTTSSSEQPTYFGVEAMRQGQLRQSNVTGAGELLRSAPYLVPFEVRSKIFQSWIAAERDHANGGSSFILPERELTVTVRRNTIFEDAFKELNGLGEGLRAKIRVVFIDEHDMQEAGIDGGGMFKEFMYEVLRLGFSPFSYALFKSTPDEHIYPNPDAPVAVESFKTQFKFLGQMLGKAVFDGLLVDIPLAKFFLLKILGEHNFPTDLASLDPELYRNMKFLKSCPAEEVEDLGLNFTVASNAFGASKEVELKKNGRNIAVSASNRIEYIHRLSNYRMNTQIQEQSDAFLEGFYNVIPSHFLRCFSHEELQLLISGKGGHIDLEDWKQNTRYSGGYDEKTPVIQWFWRTMEELELEEQAKMLQFVTSCPRAPLLGFAYLLPGFCIHRAEGDARLPTASTCMNLLKLPQYKSLDVMRDKIRYALQSNAGFDLS